MTGWTNGDEALLLDMLRLDTTTPLETGQCTSDFALAQAIYGKAAAELGFTAVYHRPAPPKALLDDRVPEIVRATALALGQDFLETQPNLVLSLGTGSDENTIAFNFHLDTVSGILPVIRKGDHVLGRGAVDDKGPGIAFLAAVRAALKLRPGLGQHLRLLIHVVAGEEGGGMGMYGTKVVAECGYLGRLNIVGEPTRGMFLDRSTASMTLRLSAAGRGSIDDAPEAGENATLLLGFLAVWISKHVVPVVTKAGGTACVAGVHTGTSHNRVYGTGTLLVNFAYGTSELALQIEHVVEREIRAALTAFTADFGHDPTNAATSAAAARMLTVEWVKRGLPTLDNRDPELEALLIAAGFSRHSPSDSTALRPFTCDAIWLQSPGSYTIVCGPGDLVDNNAHADAEHVSLAALAAYADRMTRLLVSLSDRAEAMKITPSLQPSLE